MRWRTRSGFTVVEAVVVLVVLALLLVVAIPRIRAYYHARLQAQADASPEKVFRFEVRPESIPIPADESIVVLLTIKNPTAFDLTFSWRDIYIYPSVVKYRMASSFIGPSAELVSVRTGDGWEEFDLSPDGSQQIGTIPRGGELHYRIEFPMWGRRMLRHANPEDRRIRGSLVVARPSGDLGLPLWLTLAPENAPEP